MATEVKSARGAATRDQILDAASRLMHLRGYHGTSLDDVLRESRVGKGNLYYHFRSKEDLGHAIIDRAVQGFLDHTLGPTFADRTGDPVTQIETFLGRLVSSQRERNCAGGCPMGNLAAELSDVHEGFRQRLAEIFDQWRDRLAEALERGRSTGRLRPECDPASLARFLVAALEGAILLAKVTRDITVMEQCARELRAHLDLYASPPR